VKLLSVDPSIGDCGIAILEGGEYSQSYTFRTDDKERVEERLKKIAFHFAEIGRGFDQAIIELPDSFVREGTFGLKNVRSVQLLHLSIGAIIGGLSFYPELKIEFVKVGDWKGRTPKEQTQAYARGLTGKELNTHEADAFMMGVRWLSDLRFKRAIREATLKSDENLTPTKRRFLRT
jgi:Holliday junction resolvasome RuvABC endonuclease subunit